MKTLKLFLAVFIHFSFIFSLVAQNATADMKKRAASVRFRSGWILCAEVQIKSINNPAIININRYEPPSRVSGDAAYAAVTVELDKGRSIGIYDYVLRNDRNDIYPCVAIQENNGIFDAGSWEIRDTNPKNRYTMLFKVQLPPLSQNPEYYLQFTLLEKKAGDVLVKFRNIGDKPFTPSSNIPEEGLLSIDTEKPEEKTTQTTQITEKKADTSGKQDGKVKPDPSDVEEWNKFISGNIDKVPSTGKPPGK